MLEYKINATSKLGGKAIATTNNGTINFDASAGRKDNLRLNRQKGV